MLDRLTLERFADLRGAPVILETSSGDVATELVESALLSSPSPRAVPPFRAVLRGPTGWRGAQGIYRLRHPSLGTLEMFLVPIAERDGRLDLELVCN
jgi:hypothetical protein